MSKEDLVIHIENKKSLNGYIVVDNERVENNLIYGKSFLRFIRNPNTKAHVHQVSNAFSFCNSTDTHFVLKSITNRKEYNFNKKNYSFYLKDNEFNQFMEQVDELAMIEHLYNTNKLKLQFKGNDKWCHVKWDQLTEYIDEHKDELYEEIKQSQGF